RRRAGPGVLLAQPVDEHAHLAAADRRGVQRLHKAPARAVAVEDVGGEMDRLARRGDRLEHGRIRLLAVEERRDPRAGDERPVADLVDEVLELGEVLGAVAGLARRGRGAPGAAAARDATPLLLPGERAPADAVH